MTYGVEHLLMRLLAIFIYSLVSWSFAHFLIRLFIFLLLSYNSSLYILGTSFLSNRWFANFDKIQLIFFFGCLCFWYHIPETIA